MVVYCVVNLFSFYQTEKNYSAIILQTFIKSNNEIEMEEKMKKTDLVSSLVNAKVNVNIDVTTDVKIGNQGKQGGGANI
jgi:hypothetical protein